MAADYIPGADGAFDAWQIHFIPFREFRPHDLLC